MVSLRNVLAAWNISESTQFITTASFIISFCTSTCGALLSEYLHYSLSVKPYGTVRGQGHLLLRGLFHPRDGRNRVGTGWPAGSVSQPTNSKINCLERALTGLSIHFSWLYFPFDYWLLCFYGSILLRKHILLANKFSCLPSSKTVWNEYWK